MEKTGGRISYYLHKLKHGLILTEGAYAAPPAPYWQSRLWAEAAFLRDVSGLEGGRYDALLEEALEEAYASWAAGEYLSEEACRAFEKALEPAKAACKAYTVHLVGHAHIDMNWMWPYDETCMVALDTFRTVLTLMREDPDFTFGQSQASCYRIVERYGGEEMLREIRQRVREGRWEVTASTWVEADKNMPSLESMARHALYTKRYLSRLLEIPEERMDLDFEPDTFGQSLHIPEIMRAAGVRYYYHNRGRLEPYFSRWEAPSGAGILVYRDTSWYNAVVGTALLVNALKACEISGQKNILKIYGVGDHGGGPTRRDVARLRDMMTWPIYADLRFSTYHAFFEAVDREETRIPVTRGERNAIFTGCYTTQSRIKAANRRAERVTGDAEFFSGIDSLLTGRPYPRELFREAWERTLFNQFHDIVTGSGKRETREYAMGSFQEIMALANTERTRALRALASEIDTSSYAVREELRADTAFGAGAGYGVSEGIGASSAVGGKRRTVTFFNPLPFPRKETAAVTVWDWDERDADLISFQDPEGNPVPHQILESGFHSYWNHSYLRLALPVELPAGGYATLILSEKTEEVPLSLPDASGAPGNQQHFPDEFALENEKLRVIFDPLTGGIVSFFDKETGRELSAGAPGGHFRLIEEDTDKGMTSWIVGRYKSVRPLDRGIRMKKTDGPLVREIAMEIPVSPVSRVTVRASLAGDDRFLTLETETDWHELPAVNGKIPQLNFTFPLAGKTEEFTYDVPGGAIARAPAAMDLPGLSFLAGVPAAEEEGVMLYTDSKYGYRGDGDALSVTLLRSSYDPDPLPEAGIFRTRICLAPAERKARPSELLDLAARLDHPAEAVTDAPHPGKLPVRGSFLERLRGGVKLSGVKMDEETGKKLVLRLSEVDGKEEVCSFRLFRRPAGAVFADFMEKDGEAGELSLDGDVVSFTARPYRIYTVVLSF